MQQVCVPQENTNRRWQEKPKCVGGGAEVEKPAALRGRTFTNEAGKGLDGLVGKVGRFGANFTEVLSTVDVPGGWYDRIGWWCHRMWSTRSPASDMFVI
jgi:hypothetical protein